MAQGKKIPNKFWDKNFLDALKANAGNISAACRAVNISVPSYYEHRHDNPEFSDRAEQIIDRLGMPILEDIARSKALQGDNAMLTFFLRNRGGKRWLQDRIVVDVAKEEARIEMKENRVEEVQRPPTPFELEVARAYEEILEKYDDEEM